MNHSSRSVQDVPTVTVIVLNYNGLKHLQSCFASLIRLDYPTDRLELMLVDNASSDGSVEYVRQTYPQVKIVQNTENLGFAAGNNVGARAASGQYVVFLNNDMWVDSQLIRGLIKAVQSDPKVVCAGAKILNWDGSQFDFAGSAAHFAGYAYQVGMGKMFSPDEFNEIKPMLFACGGAMMIDRQVFLEAGGFDEDYFIYYEDLDLGWRLWILGYKVVFAPDAVVNHWHHGTMDSFSDFRKKVLFKRNALYSIIKNYSDENLGRVLPAVLLATTNAVIERAARHRHIDISEYHIKDKRRPVKAIESFARQDVSTLIAIHDVVKNLPKVMEKRRFVQNHRRRSDQELAPLFRWPFRYWPDVDVQTQYKVADAFDIQTIFEAVPRRVLVISSDILPYPRMPTVGSGLRAWGLGQGLKSRGHEVLLSMPRAAIKDYKQLLPPEVVELAWEHHTIADIVRTADPDVVVVCNWPVLGLFPTNLGIPVILDQHGPHLLEREYQGYGDAHSNALQKLNALQKADYFTCAGQKQHIYFQSWLKRAGWTEREIQERTGVIPVSLSPDLPERNPANELTFVYGGVFLPWQDPSVGLSVLVDELEQRNSGVLSFYGGKHPVYPVDTGVYEHLLKQLSTSSHVIIHGMVSHDELISAYTRAHVAIDLMRRNPERELAFTTRTVEYLWCGLPVIYNDYSELSDYIREYDAGWIVNPEDSKEIRAVLNEIFEHPERIIQKSQHAQRLVREKLSWDQTITPLDRFVRRPSVRVRVQDKPAAVQNELQRLWNSAKFHYRQGGLKALERAGMNYLQRRIKYFYGG